MNTTPARFTDELLARSPHTGIDVATTLRHFAIVTYAVDPDALKAHLHPRFVPECIKTQAGRTAGLVSVVPFCDVDFRSAVCSSPRLSFGQTNYRAYVRDTQTGRRAVWFFGTCLDSWTVAMPRHVWRLPWHRGSIRFNCEYSNEERRYVRYHMRTESRWAPATLEIADSGMRVAALDGFPDLEDGLVALTHPLEGYYFRRDGKLGTYRIWHDRLYPTTGRLLTANFPLLEALRLLPSTDHAAPHSVMLQYETPFAIYLPPQRVVPGH